MLSPKEAQHYQFNTPTDCHIASFNAKSIRNSSHDLINISTICDILAVQEHRLPKQSLSYLNSLHSDFSARGISIVDDGDGVSGRPSGGFIVMRTITRPIH